MSFVGLLSGPIDQLASSFRGVRVRSVAAGCSQRVIKRSVANDIT
jgi:hypothetical protein